MIEQARDIVIKKIRVSAFCSLISWSSIKIQWIYLHKKSTISTRCMQKQFRQIKRQEIIFYGNNRSQCCSIVVKGCLGCSALWKWFCESNGKSFVVEWMVNRLDMCKNLFFNESGSIHKDQFFNRAGFDTLLNMKSMMLKIKQNIMWMWPRYGTQHDNEIQSSKSILFKPIPLELCLKLKIYECQVYQ